MNSGFANHPPSCQSDDCSDRRDVSVAQGDHIVMVAAAESDCVVVADVAAAVEDDDVIHVAGAGFHIVNVIIVEEKCVGADIAGDGQGGLMLVVMFVPLDDEPCVPDQPARNRKSMVQIRQPLFGLIGGNVWRKTEMLIEHARGATRSIEKAVKTMIAEFLRGMSDFNFQESRAAFCQQMDLQKFDRFFEKSGVSASPFILSANIYLHRCRIDHRKIENVRRRQSSARRSNLVLLPIQ